MVEIFKVFAIFLLYSFIGYIAEIIVVSLEYKKITNRGFLCGPICPIYGVGGLIMWFALKKYSGDYIAIFILGAIFASILEYFTGYILEKVFHNKWWDYKEHKYNLNGRVCLSNTLLFGLGAIIVQLATPYIYNIINIIPLYIIKTIIPISIIIFIFDLIYSWKVAFNLRKNIIVVEELKNNKLLFLPGMVETVLKQKINNIRKIPKHTLKNFPKFILNYQKEFEIINKIMENKISTIKKKRKNK